MLAIVVTMAGLSGYTVLRPGSSTRFPRGHGSRLRRLWFRGIR